jgi:hypothetical protein
MRLANLAFANDFDQAGHLQLFNVMREGRGAHTVGSLQLGAGRRIFARRDLPEHLNASRFGQNSANLRHLTARQSVILRSFHFYSSPP